MGVEGAEATAIPAESDAPARLADLEGPAADRVRVEDAGPGAAQTPNVSA